jgi:hypothetical protein
MTTETENTGSRMETLVAVLITPVTLIGALVAWRAEVRDAISDYGPAHQAGSQAAYVAGDLGRHRLTHPPPVFGTWPLQKSPCPQACAFPIGGHVAAGRNLRPTTSFVTRWPKVLPALSLLGPALSLLGPALSLLGPALSLLGSSTVRLPPAV